MTENLANILVNLLHGVNKQLVVFIVSLLPMLESRGGLIVASLLHVDFFEALIISLIGNILPIPFILILFEKIEKLLRKSKKINKLFIKLENKTLKKRAQIDKYGYLGLILFVGIPLPGTGAWTGSLLAILLDLDKKKSFVYIVLGVILASIIMSVASYLIPYLIRTL